MPAPDLRFDPPSGSALPAGPSGLVAWTPPADALSAFFLVGTAPGVGALWPVAGSPALALGEPIPVPVRAEGPTFVVGVVELESLTRFAVIAQYRPLDARESVYAAAKRMLREYFFTAWLGADRLNKSWCPAVMTNRADDEIFALSGEDAEASCAPWTPAEVAAGVGYALVKIQEFDRQPDNIVAGADVDGRSTAGVIVWLRFAVEFAVPTRTRAADAVLQRRCDEFERLFTGKTLIEAGPPRIELRQLAERPVRDAQIGSDSSWLRRGMVAPIRAHARILQIGTQET